MKKALKKTCAKELYHFVDGVRISGVHSGLSGNVTGMSGDVTGLWGNVTGMSGDVTGLWGNVTGLSGDVDECDISDDDRLRGVNIRDLVED